MTAVQARITDRISSHHPLGLPTASGTSVNSAWGRDGAGRERDQDDSGVLPISTAHRGDV